jgi:hypothetical protein
VRRAIELLDSYGAPSIRLDATSLGQPLYEKLGFVVEYEVARYAGVLAPQHEIPGESEQSSLSASKYADLEHVLALDFAVTGTDRRRFLERLLSEPTTEARVVEQSGQIEGYLVTRPGRTSIQLGPFLASPIAAKALTADATSRHAGRRAFLDIPLYNRANVKLAQRLGFAVQRTFLRMCRGPSVKEDRGRFVAGSGPELG